MAALSHEQAARRERTLLAALLLSVWAPLATGLAVLSSHSTTQLADFIRRTVELIALFVSWWVFRQLQRNEMLDDPGKARLERAAGLSVAGALGVSGVVMLAVALSRLSAFQPGGRVTLGLVISGLGLLTNAWFWRRYAILTREHFTPVMAAQQQLYRAKTSVDLCVVAALTAVAVAPGHPATRTVDLLGSILVALYLLWSAMRTTQAQLEPMRRLFHRLRKQP